MLDVEGFILVGGGSTRMGADKSSLMLGGETTVKRIARALFRITDEVRLVGASKSAVAHSLPTVPDVYRSWGPLGGIHAALSASQREWCLLVACDLPFVTTELFERLSAAAARDFDAIVPRQDDGRPQPLCALYRRERCLSAAQRSIEHGHHTPRALLDLVPTRYISFSELSDLPAADYLFFNVNTPENYELAKHLVQNTGVTAG